jgi:DNA-binding response OmpR family regulator
MRRRKLVLIEPEAHRREAIQRVFVGKGWEVAMAATQAEGLALLSDYYPHWVVVSATLPDGDGGSVLAHVRETRRARVAVLAGAADDARVMQILGWKPSLLVADPLDPDDLYRQCAGEDDPQSAIG